MPSAGLRTRHRGITPKDGTKSDPNTSSPFSCHLAKTEPCENPLRDDFDSDFDDIQPRNQQNKTGCNVASNHSYRVYPARWLMLFYLSLLNLLSDWTGLSVAPIATLTSRAYADDSYSSDQEKTFIQPEALVTVFLIASSVGTAIEPWILGRLGLRRTVVAGAFLNMLGSLIKSGGLPPISFLSIPSLHKGLYGIYALYTGFFFVGFAQPLFQCTPALLSASWFPEEERTLATSIALNSNQLGIGCAFVVGALWVRSPSQIPNYFGLLSLLSVVAFVGCVLQLDDAPPTPPSGSSRIMRGTLEISVKDLIQRASSNLLVGNGNDVAEKLGYNLDVAKLSFKQWAYCGSADVCASSVLAPSSTAGAPSIASATNSYKNSFLNQYLDHQYPEKTSPSSSFSLNSGSSAPSHFLLPPPWSPSVLVSSYSMDEYTYYTRYPYEGAEPTVTQTPHHLEIDIRDDQIFLAAKACFARQGFSHALVVFVVTGAVVNTLSTYLDYLVRVGFDVNESDGDNKHYDGNRSDGDESSDPSEESYSAAVYVAIIGGLFQIIIMFSSIVVGFFTDKTRSYFIVILVLLVMGALALAECGVSLDENRGGDVRWTMLLVAGLLGPLVPVATELGVEMAYPLSENTILVILQLTCNVFSALFIPLFQALRDVGVYSSNGDGNKVRDDDGAEFVLGSGRPPYTFSFYLLILLCATSAVYFATFDGKYLRLESELAKKGDDEQIQRPSVTSAENAVPLIA